MIRRLSGFTGLLVAAPAALGMGLGEPINQSWLGQPLAIAIPLTEVNDWRRDQIKVTVDGEAGASIRKLDIDLQNSEHGYHIVLRSTDPQHEPSLAFSVAVRWPAGNMQRNYQLLLDPPPLD